MHGTDRVSPVMQGRAAKQNAKAASESDIEIDLASRENVMHANGSLPAIVGHVPQLVDEPEEAADDNDADEGSEPEGEDELLSPIPDLPTMNQPSKPQNTPLLATMKNTAK